MDSQAVQTLISINDRLARIETTLGIGTADPLPARVARLEGWRNKMAGGLIVGNLFVAGVMAWFKRH